ncbi:DNA-binding transcriptional regulator, LysR family [Rubritalea squalenifaciens DSM 18772]|uniref:DNA-binding transcriptional regulator, LysR family n=2 Tax=Rubritalea TaxID=361050 RepID=A0A1M6NTA8_9BACT|nr:LysR family transcriptional regulator [Rubritalea squalenifaciens]SHJ98890.1 DNA-binding transcriptional regulator, LysR family [Rubritalea squalenifaciens DSM 18772]
MNLPEIRQLKIFIALEETRSFTTAAKRCFITQSAVSHSLKSLEKQLGSPLIERMGKRVILTPYGEVFLHHAKRVIRELEECLTKLDTLKRWGYSSLRIGAPDSICQHVLPQVIKDFREKYPKCEVSIHLGDTAEVQRMIKNGEMDLAFGIHLAPNDPQFTFTPLAADTLCFITAPDHPWTKLDPTEKKDLSKVRLISYSASSETQRLITRHFSEHVVQHFQPMALGNMEAIKEMTKQGLGVGIIPRWVVKKELEDGSLIEHAISSPPPQRQWGVFSGGNKTFSLAEEEFIDFCREHLTATVEA